MTERGGDAASVGELSPRRVRATRARDIFGRERNWCRALVWGGCVIVRVLCFRHEEVSPDVIHDRVPRRIFHESQFETRAFTSVFSWRQSSVLD